jgi:hypothetical protein
MVYLRKTKLRFLVLANISTGFYFSNSRFAF